MARRYRSSHALALRLFLACVLLTVPIVALLHLVPAFAKDGGSGSSGGSGSGGSGGALTPLQKALRGSRSLIGDDPPEAAVIRAKIAWSLYYLERHREALAVFIRASLASPSSPQLQAGMGWCYIKLGQKGDARAAFQQALDLRPDDQVVREALRGASL